MRRIQPSALITHILIILFGSSAWISVDGTWVQLPLMVTVLPEGWSLPSYLAIIVQLGSIGPLLYAVAKKVFPYAAKHSPRLNALASSSFGKNFTPSPLIYATLGVLILCHVLMAIFWRRTSIWANGVEHSTTFFVLFFFMSVVNCLSNVLYLPYMSRFRPTYTTAYFIGMGSSALLSSLLGFIQGSGRIDCVRVRNDSSIVNETAVEARPVLPLFGVGAFNAMICVWLSIVVVGFYFLNRLPQLRTERSSGSTGTDSGAEDTDKTRPPAEEIDKQKSETGRLSCGGKTDTKAAAEIVETVATRGRPVALSRFSCFYHLISTVWLSVLMNGVLPSVQSFSTLPYGQLTYHLAVTISNLANPIACFVPLFIQLRRVNLVIGVWTIIGSLLSAYILAAAAWSPRPLLGSGGRAVGPASSILSWTLVIGILAYLRSVIASKLQESGGGDAGSENRLFWCGLLTQAGAFLGAVIMFPLINFRQIFKSAPSCPA